MTTPLNNHQIPDKSILDINGRQTYLGNSFALLQNGVGTIISTETAITHIINPVGSGKSLFFYSRKAATDVTYNAIIRFYLNPTVTSSGAATLPLVQKSGTGNTSISQCYLTPTVSLVAAAQVRTLTSFHAGSVYDVTGAGKAIQLYDSPSVGYYFWASCSNGTHVTTDPALAGTGVNVVLTVGLNANQVATAFYTAIAAVTGHFTATNTPAGTVTVTNVTTGADLVQDSISGAAATLTVTTNGSSLGAGTLIAKIPATPQQVQDMDLYILDPGDSILITAQPQANTPNVYLETMWFEI